MELELERVSTPRSEEEFGPALAEFGAAPTACSLGPSGSHPSGGSDPIRSGSTQRAPRSLQRGTHMMTRQLSSFNVRTNYRKARQIGDNEGVPARRVAVLPRHFACRHSIGPGR